MYRVTSEACALVPEYLQYLHVFPGRVSHRGDSEANF